MAQLTWHQQACWLNRPSPHGSPWGPHPNRSVRRRQLPAPGKSDVAGRHRIRQRGGTGRAVLSEGLELQSDRQFAVASSPRKIGWYGFPTSPAHRPRHPAAFYRQAAPVPCLKSWRNLPSRVDGGMLHKSFCRRRERCKVHQIVENNVLALRSIACPPRNFGLSRMLPLPRQVQSESLQLALPSQQSDRCRLPRRRQIGVPKRAGPALLAPYRF